MSKKFRKKREVDRLYLNVPVKYVLNYKGANEGGKDKYRSETYDEWKQHCLDSDLFFEAELTEARWKQYVEYCKENGIETKDILVKRGKDKILTIIDFYGKKALVAWRNSNTCKVGMTKLCPLIWKHGKLYLKYKDDLILISNKSGWVI